jgi:hypothetical protein
MRTMRTTAAAALLFAMMGAGSALAYERYNSAGTSCITCHPGFEGGNAVGLLHAVHLSSLGITECNFCHPNGGGSLPVRTVRSGPDGGLGCAGCHGQDYGEVASLDGLPKASGYGLRLFHASKGVNCNGCHGLNPGPALAEDVKPPYYLMAGSDLHAACDSAEEDFPDSVEITPDSVGLDNDGNGFADFPADPNCGPATTTTSTTSTTTTTLPLECGGAPSMTCTAAGQAKLNINEKVAGKEKMKASLQKIVPATAQADFGDPVDGDTAYILCVYNSANALVADYKVKRAGESCGDDPCWVDVKTTGYKYQDKEPDSDGIAKIQLKSGDAGKGQVKVNGKNTESALPTGIAAAMSGQTSSILQFLTSDQECFGATLSEVKTADGLVFQAATP